MVPAETNRANRKKAYIRALLETASKVQARAAAGIRSNATIERWMREDPRFGEFVEQALEDALDAIEVEIRRRGLHGVEEIIVTPKGVAYAADGKTPLTQRKYSDSLLALSAKSLLRHKYGDRSAVELTGRDGGAIQVESPLERITGRLAALAAAKSIEARTIEGRVASEPPLLVVDGRTADDPYGVHDL